MPIDRGMDKEDVVPTHNGVSAIKRNEMLPFAETWTDLEIVVQSEVSQKGKNKYHVISLICGL